MYLNRALMTHSQQREYERADLNEKWCISRQQRSDRLLDDYQPVSMSGVFLLLGNSQISEKGFQSFNTLVS